MGWKLSVLDSYTIVFVAGIVCGNLRYFKSQRRDLDPRPSDYKSDALARLSYVGMW